MTAQKEVDGLHHVFLKAPEGKESLKVLTERGEELRKHAAACAACEAKRQRIIGEYEKSLSPVKRERLRRATGNLLGTLGRNQ